MGIPYEISNQLVTVASGSPIVAFNVPSRQQLEKLVVVGPTADFSVDVWNRAFTSDALDLLAVENDGNGKCRLLLAEPLSVRVGDPLTVAGNTVGGYNAVHRVVALLDNDMRIVTDQDFSLVGEGGTVQLDIGEAEQELYRVLPRRDASGGVVSYFADGNGPTLTCQDPTKHQGSTFQRRVYLEFSAPGDYRVTLALRAPEYFG